MARRPATADVRHRAQPDPDGGFTLIDLLVALAAVVLLVGLSVTALQRSLVKVNINAVAADARQIHEAFSRYYAAHGRYPNAGSNPGFQLDTFEPLRGMGYYQGNVVARLIDHRADAFDSPGDQGQNQEYWLQLTLEVDPSVQFIVADSDDAPLGNGWQDGVYMFRDGQPITIEDHER